jgi:hypothetical protein
MRYNGNTGKGGSKVLQGFDEWLLHGAEEALGEDTVCEGECTCGAECVIEDKPKMKLEFWSPIYGVRLEEAGEV